MPRSGTFLEAATSYYSTLAFDAIAAMRQTQEDLRTGNFQVSKTIGSVASLWLDACEGWWSALLVTASEPLPTVFLRVGIGGTATRDLKVLVREPPDFTGLVRVGGREAIPEARVSIKPSSKTDFLEVKLTGLSPLIRDGIVPPGLYQGLVHIGDKALGIVMVRVDPPPPEEPPAAGAAKAGPGKKKSVKKR